MTVGDWELTTVFVTTTVEAACSGDGTTVATGAVYAGCVKTESVTVITFVSVKV
jgi:hypothetical protein